MFLTANTSPFLQTVAADAHLAEGQLSYMEQALNNVKSPDIPSRNSETNNFQNGKAEFETRVNLSEKGSIGAVPPHT
jgi:hypothetical protein